MLRYGGTIRGNKVVELTSQSNYLEHNYSLALGKPPMPLCMALDRDVKHSAQIYPQYDFEYIVGMPAMLGSVRRKPEHMSSISISAAVAGTL
jgi:hypothetical protein